MDCKTDVQCTSSFEGLYYKTFREFDFFFMKGAM
jgi:hypothetical protein